MKLPLRSEMRFVQRRGRRRVVIVVVHNAFVFGRKAL